MSDTAPSSPIQTPVVVRGRPRKTIEEQIKEFNDKTNNKEEKRKQHNERMKKYYHDHKEGILAKKKLKRDALKAT